MNMGSGGDIGGVGDDGHLLSAGFKLMTKFQNQWTLIHARSENNVIKACTASNKLGHLERSSSRQQKALEEFIGSYKSLTLLEEQIKSVDRDLNLLENSFLQIEDLLIVLKNHRENLNTNKYVEETKTNYEAQVKDLKAMSNARKEKLALDHQQRVRDFENKQQLEWEERRRVLEKAFEEEKTRYLKEKSKQL